MLWAYITARLGKIGTWIASAVALAGALILAVLRIKAAGRAEERAAQAEETAKAVKTAKEVSDEVHSLDRADVDPRLARWMRDGGGKR